VRIAGVLLLFACVGIVGRSDYENALITDAIRKDPPQVVLVNPLGCPAEDRSGRALRATIDDKGRIQCYYGPRLKHTKQGRNPK
jgi:hypothetical protein